MTEAHQDEVCRAHLQCSLIAVTLFFTQNTSARLDSCQGPGVERSEVWRDQIQRGGWDTSSAPGSPWEVLTLPSWLRAWLGGCRVQVQCCSLPLSPQAVAAQLGC